MVSSTTTAMGGFGNVAFAHGGQQYASISAAAGGTRELVAAVTGSKIRVLAIVVLQDSDAAAAFQFKSATTALTGEFTVAITAEGHMVLPFSPVGWFETAAGEALNVTVAANVLVGCLVYDEVAAG